MFNTLIFDQPGGFSDPFHVFLNLVDKLGPGQVFLLDSAVDDSHPEDRLSILGALPILDLNVKDGVVELTALAALSDYLSVALAGAGYHPQARPTDLYESQVMGVTSVYAGEDPMLILEHVRVAVRQLLPLQAHAPFSNGLLGYMGYDAVHYLEKLPKTTVDDRDLPDVRLQWHLVTLHLHQGQARVYDALPALVALLGGTGLESWQKRVHEVVTALQTPSDLPSLLERLTATGAGETAVESGAITEDVRQVEFEHRVRRAKQYIESGDIFQVVLSKRLRVPRTMHPYLIYERLRKVNPSPYMFMAEYPNMRLFGASPEVQFRSLDGIAEMKPIAGTSKGRGATQEEDQRLAQRLLTDEKERAEHVMLVDLCRNDLGRVCQSGSIEVTRFMTVEAYSHLFHLVSTVRGRLRPDVSVFQALLSTFPAGTLSGAPKIRAMEIIDELESLRRGPYGGLIGMVDFDANANTAIVIRSVVDTKEHYYIQVGAGIVADSDPAEEWFECGHKSGALVHVLTDPAVRV